MVTQIKSLVVVLAILSVCSLKSGAEADPPEPRPTIEDYATVEAYVGKDKVPVYAFGYTYVFSLSPDLLPGVKMQEGNNNPIVKFKPKKSWEIKSNFCGSTPAREPKTMWNDDQPLLPVHLIDGDPETAWCSRGGSAPDRQPEWIRIDLPAESTVSSVALVCSKVGPSVNASLKVGKVLPRELTVKVSKDAQQWDTVYETKDFKGPDDGPSVIEFSPRPVKQISIIANNLQRVGTWGYAFSIGEVEVRNSQGENLALLSRGAGVQTSSTYLSYGMDRFTQEMLWPLQYDLGFKWTRVGYDLGVFLWNYVEREKGKLQIDAKADAAITEARRNGVSVILCLDKGNWLYHNPPRKVDWKLARTSEMMDTYYDHQGWPSDSDEMLKGYLRYVDYMVRHFQGRVAYYEICNEWNCIDQKAYHKILLATIPVIKEADPKAKIMLGAVTPKPDGGGIWAEPIYACLDLPGVAKQLDAIGWHPFYQSDPDSHQVMNYRKEVEEFKKQCTTRGFKGEYAASEWTWAAPYPPVQSKEEWWGTFACTEMTKAKYCAQLMTAHCGMDIISLYNETFQTGKIDWDCTLLRNSSLQVDPITPAQPQPIYYVLRSISTVLDGFKAASFEVRFSGDKQYDCYTFSRSGKELMVAAWIQGKTKDGVVEARSDVTLPGVQAKQAWVVDIFNGTEQQVVTAQAGPDCVLKGMLVKDYPVFIRMEQ